MKIRVVLAQMEVEQNIDKNGSKIVEILLQCQTNDWVIFPEGALSWYTPDDPHFASLVQFDRIDYWLSKIKKLVIDQQLHVAIGTLSQRNDGIYNTALYIDFRGNEFVYDKYNLGLNDKENFKSGKSLNVYNADGITFGMQICRDNTFPEQWRLLKQKGAQVVFHLNNAVRKTDSVRKNILITRAFENQYYVCSTNNLSGFDTVPSVMVNPMGDVVSMTDDKTGIISGTIDLDECRSDYIDQMRIHIKE